MIELIIAGALCVVCLFAGGLFFDTDYLGISIMWLSLGLLFFTFYYYNSYSYSGIPNRISRKFYNCIETNRAN